MQIPTSCLGLLGNVMEECRDAKSALHAYQAYVDAYYDFYEFRNDQLCVEPCLKKRFKAEVKHYHKTTWINLSGEYSGVDEFYLTMVYTSLDIESRNETLFYDTGSMLAAAGGNLGLLLGFSCLTCVAGIIDLMEIMFNKILRK